MSNVGSVGLAWDDVMLKSGVAFRLSEEMVKHNMELLNPGASFENVTFNVTWAASRLPES